LTAAACGYLGGVYRGNNTACAPGLCPLAFAYSGDPIQVPDGSGMDGCGPVASATVVVAQNFPVGTVEAAFAIAHLWQGDLRIELAKEGGPTVVLVDRPGYPQSNYGFSGDDYGAPAGNPTGYFRSTGTAAAAFDLPGVVAPGVPQPTGAWLSEGWLGAFTGIDSAGTWHLNVTDCAGGDAGTIYRFELLLGIGPCFANCDGSTVAPVLNANDFQCFLNYFAAGDTRANCDASSTPPVLNANDFQCFLNKFAVGCG
jgi:subtilisin-like proprotein convertase family protein